MPACSPRSRARPRRPRAPSSRTSSPSPASRASAAAAPARSPSASSPGPRTARAPCRDEARAVLERYLAIAGDPDAAAGGDPRPRPRAGLDLARALDAFEERTGFMAARGLDVDELCASRPTSPATSTITPASSSRSRDRAARRRQARRRRRPLRPACCSISARRADPGRRLLVLARPRHRGAAP